ncbi:MAG TPA: tetratricopeptide repeat protein [Candidatus Udaeobacter sp.]|nr:tetratricopeptide repeat protein [Candidatus Udaeobacter sp.]
MPTDSELDLQLEIGHVLLIDIVGYSKLLITEQRERLQALNGIVRNTAQFRASEAKGMLVRIPTGDGMALIFRDTVEAPLRCAVEISESIKTHPEIHLRMGIHSGPVSEVRDVNERTNIAGAGIDIAQRVMDCGDAGHILLSKHVAEDLAPHPRWNRCVHDLGECEVKHGTRVSVVNVYDDQFGNATLPGKFQIVQKRRARMRWTAGAAALLALAMIIGGIAMLSRYRVRSTLPVPDKSIAVLPFENLSHDPDNAYFAEGMQDEILARLSKIADLKVISRTSTQKYKSTPENLRDIAKQLGVANILEGSVQKAADQVRVNVKLINALNDAHLWGDVYDRKLTDIFSVESDIAKTVADTLQAKLTGAEKQLIAAQPTSDTTAYELYVKGRLLWSRRGSENLRQAIAFYEQAIARDPNYALAYAGMAEAYVILPFYAGTPQGEVFPKARAAALKALQLDDKLAGAHTGLAWALCYDFDMVGSISEFQRAIALNPNYATAHQWYGRHPLTALGRLNEAIAEGKRATELDPLSPVINTDLGQTLFMARRYDEAIAQVRKTLEIDPTFYYAHYTLGMALQLKGDVASAITEYTKAQQLSDDLRIQVLLAAAKAQSGDKDAATQMLAELEELNRHRYVRSYWRALLYLSQGKRDEAIRWLEKGIADHEGLEIAWIKVDPMLDQLRGDPRFDALVQKVVGAEHKQ